MQKYLLFLLATLILFTTASIAEAKKDGTGKPVRARITLQPAGSDQDARGFAELSYKAKKKGIDQTFHVKVEKLNGNASFTLVVDGITITTFTTTNGGTYEAFYDSTPHGAQLPIPADLDPVTDIKLVEVKNADGETVLTGDFSAGNGGGEEMEAEISLTNTGIDTDATGSASIQIETEDGIQEQQFKVDINNLAATTAYKIFVNGVELATVTTSSSGGVGVTFSSAPTGNELALPAELNPVTNIKLIEIKDSTGQVLLTGSFEATSGGGGEDGKQSISLASTGIDTDARGHASIESNERSHGKGNQEAKFEVEVENLAVGTSYKLFVNGSELATLTTGNHGEAKIKFSSKPKKDEFLLPSSLIPLTNIDLVEIRTTDGQVLLSGMFN